jgi:hypothetical protein
MRHTHTQEQTRAKATATGTAAGGNRGATGIMHAKGGGRSGLGPQKTTFFATAVPVQLLYQSVSRVLEARIELMGGVL